MKGKSKGSWRNLGFPAIFFLCFIFFVVGFMGCILLSHQVDDLSETTPRSRLLESVDPALDPMPHGETGDSFIVSIPFQVLSRKPRAFYFPKFATADQCQKIIKMAKANLVPSSLALRKGETAENTHGIRTSSGTFISASEDKSGILDIIERKMERVTMIPRAHGEAFNILRYELGQRYNSHYDAFNPAEYGPQKSQREHPNAERRDGPVDPVRYPRA